MTLHHLGWDDDWAGHFAAAAAREHAPARVVSEHKGLYRVAAEAGEMAAWLTGRLQYDAARRADLPVVGDWVVTHVMDDQPPQAVIHAVLPRRSLFSRKEAGRGAGEQPLAANVDTALLVVGLDGNYSLRRIERYLTLAWQSGARPVILLTKADVCPEAAQRLHEAERAAAPAPVHAISVVEGQGLAALDQYLLPGRTLVLLGSSGVGKSTLTNHLKGSEIQKVQDVRADDSKGRHTTTHRELFVLPSGALIIDTPGMRELGLYDADDGLAAAFADIGELARHCRFADCLHTHEPGCRVREALNAGALDAGRYDNYLRMQGELRYQARRTDVQAALAEKRRWKQIHKAFRKKIE